MLINSYELIRQTSIFFHVVEVSDTRHTCIQCGKFYYIIRCRRGQWVKKMCCTENLTIMLHACQRPWLGCKKITYAKIHMVNYHADKVVSSRYYYHDYQYQKFLCASLQCLWKIAPHSMYHILARFYVFLILPCICSVNWTFSTTYHLTPNPGLARIVATASRVSCC